MPLVRTEVRIYVDFSFLRGWGESLSDEYVNGSCQETRTIEECRARLPKGTYSKELVELLFVQPYRKIDHLTKAGIAKRRTASTYLKELKQIGVLKSFQAWKETIYFNTRLYDIFKIFKE